MNNADLQTQLKSLKLSGMAEGLDLRLMEAAQNQLGYSEFSPCCLPTNWRNETTGDPSG